MTDSTHLFQFDPWSDWVADKRRVLLRLDARAGSAPDLEVARMWLGLQQRLIEDRPRRVFKPENFACSSDEEAPLLDIERRAQQGRELNSFLSKQTRNPFERDALLADWGIHHFHLNIALDANEFRRRSGRLLFARVRPDAIYFIAVGDHTSWSDVDLIEILHRQWPTSIEMYRLPGLPAPRSTWTPEERIGLRRCGVQTIVSTTDGTSYAPIGGGYASDGSSIAVSDHLSQIREYMFNLREWVANAEDEIRQKCWAQGVNPDDLSLTLHTENELPYAVDDRLDVCFRLPELQQRRSLRDGE